MKAPYAKKWQKETDSLRKIVLACDLTEQLKWSKPWFTDHKKNVAIVIPLAAPAAETRSPTFLLGFPTGTRAVNKVD